METYGEIPKSSNKKSNKRKETIILSLFAISVLIGIVGLIIKPTFNKYGKLNSKVNIPSSSIPVLSDSGVAIVNIEGVITLQRGSSIFGDAVKSRAEKIMNELDTYSENPNVKAIVLLINSPGGTAVAASEIYEKIIQIKEEKNIKIVAVMREVAASGGYYIAAAADTIIAGNGTITGSIGVIISTMNMTGLMDKVGVKAYTFKSGEYKDILSPYRELSDSEIEYMDGLVLDIQKDFVDAVLDGRGDKIKSEDTNFLFDGRIFNGEQASNYGLVDEIGTLEDGVKVAAELAGIEDEDPTIIKLSNEPGVDFFKQLFNTKLSGDIFGIKALAIDDLLGVEYAGVPMYLYIGGGK